MLMIFYWYTSEALVKWFVGTLEYIFHVKLFLFAHWFMSISISHLKYHSISVDQARYDNSVVSKYLDAGIVKKSTKFYKTTLTSDMIFKNDDLSNSDEQVYHLSSEFKIHYISCIGSLICLLFKRVDLIL